ncbi:amino acid permease [Candidatus Macondimonas diazotrophica]|jgi:APA family basic amino acid/polyamine antiporter|uniref:Amino acid permease n=1 Tax=Candidatus Macondimonas diazotrophica TaxID=2305248 RepID=A0A4Z0FAT4_9GAMM|nr:amino acid permease [Candidatus Macondimonas diazotrophica]NCU00653.1 amino acid permease [Candidatus Macondimonas diazotrophica]TFZ83552.1 amino acid permease [Candidatus Macondimonas diazotrophica]
MAGQGWWRTKPIDQALEAGEGGLHRVLSGLDLTFLGIGAVIGAGIFVLTGIAAATKAGPALTLSFVIAGMACLFAALVYAEFASTVPLSGSAYTYSYVTLGELPAWIIGWDLILEYSVASAAVAIGWSGYFNRVLEGLGLGLPEMLTRTPFDGGWINLPAFVVILVVSALLAVGVRETSRFNNAMVVLKLGIIALFLVTAIPKIDVTNWDPYFPFGWSGVVGGAGLIFFAYIGFDAVSTAAEEARDPQRDIPRGILGSLVICTLIYILVAGALTGIVNYTQLNVPDPVAAGLALIGAHSVAGLISVGAIAGLSSVLLVLLYGQSRIFFAMSRDGLLPPVFSRVHPRFRTPFQVVLMTGLVVALVAGFMPIRQVAELVNVGTLAAFILVSVAVMVLRYTRPDLHRPFRTPLVPLIPLLAIAFCAYLIASLDAVTLWRFVAWMALGMAVYVFYARHHSRLRSEQG